ncbi:hypothetical protein HRbin23_01190 [bacterium HR23]|nr:hypothetical protein HRbin23_01190 [bacterium HR23]
MLPRPRHEAQDEASGQGEARPHLIKHLQQRGQGHGYQHPQGEGGKARNKGGVCQRPHHLLPGLVLPLQHIGHMLQGRGETPRMLPRPHHAHEEGTEDLRVLGKGGGEASPLIQGLGDGGKGSAEQGIACLPLQKGQHPQKAPPAGQHSGQLACQAHQVGRRHRKEGGEEVFHRRKPTGRGDLQGLIALLKHQGVGFRPILGLHPPPHYPRVSAIGFVAEEHG